MRMRSTLLLIAASAAAAPLLAQPNDSSPPPPPPVAGSPDSYAPQPGIAPEGSGRGAWLLSRLHEANRQQIRLGRLAEDRAASERVRDYGRELVEDHRRLDERLRDLAQDKGIDLNSNQTFAGDRDPEQREVQESLEHADGRRFDREFVRTMAEQHERLINLLERSSDRVQDEDVRRFVQRTLSELREHRHVARDLERDLE